MAGGRLYSTVVAYDKGGRNTSASSAGLLIPGPLEPTGVREAGDSDGGLIFRQNCRGASYNPSSDASQTEFLGLLML